MSLRPGIGAGFVPEVSSSMLTHRLDELMSIVPTGLRQGSTVRPLGRYLSRLLREHVGRSPNAEPEAIQAQQERMRPLQEMARQIAPRNAYHSTLRSLVLEANEGQYIRFLANQKRKAMRKDKL